jgi:hypothetical protein
MTYAQFYVRHNLTFTAQRVPSRPDHRGMAGHIHFKCRIEAGEPIQRGIMARKSRRGFTLYYSRPAALGGIVPEFGEVLHQLARDARRYEDTENFDQWARGSGYDPDSRSIERIYRSIKRQSEQLKRTISIAAYQELLTTVH